MNLIIIPTLVPDSYVRDSGALMTSLSSTGFTGANEILKKIKVDNGLIPDIIYSSPFLSAMQTVYPICNYYNIDINIENSLCSTGTNIENSEHLSIKQHYKYLTDFVNTDYESSIFINNVRFKESAQDIRNRVYPFLHRMVDGAGVGAGAKAIALVTHSNITDVIVEFFNIERNKTLLNSLIIISP